MRWIYLSPHLDDAVLSAGGLIYEQTRAGMPVEIWSLMCGFPSEDGLTDLAKVMHMLWGTSSAEETIRIRREEDKRAVGIIGAQALHFDFLDCIYRRGPHGEAFYSDVFAPPHAAEADLPAQVAGTISERLQPDDVLVCQLAIGGHVDHVIARRAAESLHRPLIYDADIPYLLNHPQELTPKTAGMRGSVEAVSEAGLESWLEAIAAYQSQMPMLFESLEMMREKMRAYWSQNRGLPFWQPA